VPHAKLGSRVARLESPSRHIPAPVPSCHIASRKPEVLFSNDPLAGFSTRERRTLKGVTSGSFCTILIAKNPFDAEHVYLSTTGRKTGLQLKIAGKCSQPPTSKLWTFRWEYFCPVESDSIAPRRNTIFPLQYGNLSIVIEVPHEKDARIRARYRCHVTGNQP